MMHDIFKDGMTPDKVAFAGDIWLCEFFIDQMEAANMRITAYAKQNGLFMRDSKMAINKAKHAIKEMADNQRKTLGDDKVATFFGKNSDVCADILKAVIFVPMVQKRSILKEIKRVTKTQKK